MTLFIFISGHFWNVQIRKEVSKSEWARVSWLILHYQSQSDTHGESSHYSQTFYWEKFDPGIYVHASWCESALCTERRAQHSRHMAEMCLGIHGGSIMDKTESDLQIWPFNSGDFLMSFFNVFFMIEHLTSLRRANNKHNLLIAISH